MSSSYHPIDCGLYDHLEIFAMRGTALAVDYVTPEGAARRREDAVLVTLRQTAGEEIGVFRGTDGEVVEVRLDRLQRLTPSEATGAPWAPSPEAEARP